MQLPGRLWLRVFVAGISTDWVDREVTAPDHRDSQRFSRNGRRHAQFLAGRALARRMLKGLTGEGAAWVFGQDLKGRPIIHDNAQRQGPEISISHSGDWVACAIASARRIGVDLEQARPGRRYREIAASYFSEVEIKAIDAEGETAFLSAWTLREAVAKAEGTGLTGAMNLDGACLMPARDRQHALTLEGEDWTLAHRHREALHLAVAWKSGQLSADTPALVEREMAAAFLVDPDQIGAVMGKAE
jgi:phosphopantetheinyl transferase